MNYNGIEFETVIATPGCGKSYLSDKYPHLFADMDEIRLKLKYDIPEGISREELETFKGNRSFKKKTFTLDELYAIYDENYRKGKTLIAAPHDESFKYFEERKNSPKFIQENIDKFDEFYISNAQDKRAVIHYEFSANEYLSDILVKFGLEI